MRDIGISPEDVEASVPVQRTAGFALEVINRLVARKTLGAGCVLDHLVDRLLQSLRVQDAQALHAVLADLRKARIRDEAIVTQYIPEVARRLGEGWNNDSLSFLEVTLGAARLAEMVRELGSAFEPGSEVEDADVSVLLIVPPGEQHTLGSGVLACQLRLQGVSVCLRLAPSLADLAALLSTRQFDGAMISVGSHERVEHCAVLVKTLHTLTKGQLPVAVGGSVMDEERDLLVRIGADLVTNNIEAALASFRAKSAQKA